MNDYAGRASDLTHQLGAAAMAAAQRQAELKAELDEQTRRKKLYDDLTELLAKGWSMHVLDLLSRSRSTLEKIETSGDTASPLIREVEEFASAQADAVSKGFSRAFPAECDRVGLPLDPSSRHPRYTFEGRFLELAVDDKRRRARLSTALGRLGDLPADPQPLAELVLREHRRLFDRPANPVFLERLLVAYQAALADERRPDGEAVPIRALMDRLAQGDKAFKADAFVLDLSRAAASDGGEPEGFRLTLQHTKDTREGILLHPYGSQGYVGFAAFRRAP